MKLLSFFSRALFIISFASASAQANYCLSIYEGAGKGFNGAFITQCNGQAPSRIAIGGWFTQQPHKKNAVDKITKDLSQKGYSPVGSFYYGNVIVYLDQSGGTSSTDQVCLLAQPDGYGDDAENIIDCGDGALIEVGSEHLSSYLNSHGYGSLYMNVGEIRFPNRRGYDQNKKISIYKKQPLR